MSRLTILLLMLVFMAASNVQAQHEVVEVPENDVVGTPMPEGHNGVDPDEVYKIVEDMPKFPGGEMAMMQYLSSVQYPAEALKNKQQGTSFISLIIEKDGSISNVYVARSSGFEILDKVAAEHIAAMPNWKPGTQRSKPVRVQYVIPIKFKL